MNIVPDGRTYIRQAQSNILGKAFYDFRGPIAAVFSFGVDILPTVEPKTDPDLSEISLSEEELLDGQGQSPTPHDWHMQTSGIPIEEVGVSSEEHYADLDDEEVFEAPTYTAEQRQEVLGRAVYRGHNLTLADDFWAKEGRKTFIDASFKLPNGILKAISLFVHDAPLPLEDIEMYLELWTRHGAETTNFKLEWQKKVKLTRGPNRLYEVRTVLSTHSSFHPDINLYSTKTYEKLMWIKQVEYPLNLNMIFKLLTVLSTWIFCYSLFLIRGIGLWWQTTIDLDSLIWTTPAQSHSNTLRRDGHCSSMHKWH